MPIINLVTSKENLPEGAQNVRQIEQGWLYDTHIGYCLYDFERNGYDDSDFIMVVWNPETKKPEEHLFASTRGWTYPMMASAPDATPEVMEAYNAWRAEERERQERYRLEALELQKEMERARPEVGRVVEVFKGRKVTIGTVGTCFWKGMGNYGERVGLKDAEGNVHWTASSNCRAVAR